MRLFFTLSIILLLFLPGCWRKQVVHSDYPDKVLTSPSKHIKDMDVEEALEAKYYYEATNNTFLLTKVLERILAASTDHHILADVLLELADLELRDGQLENAQKHYQEYKTLYPGNRNYKKALMREIQSHYDAIDSADRDQAETHETITLIDEFLVDFDDQEEPDEIDDIKKEPNYIQQAYDLRNTCYKKLIEHELFKVEFYCNKYTYEPNFSALKSARSHLQHIEKELLPHVSNTEKLCDSLKKELAAEPLYTAPQQELERLRACAIDIYDVISPATPLSFLYSWRDKIFF